MLLRTRFWPEIAAFLKTVWSFKNTRFLFVIQTSNFYVVSKFCVEAVSQKFAVFLMTYGVSRLLMHILFIIIIIYYYILIHWLTA